MLDSSLSNRSIERLWADEIVPELHRYIEIPALSPAFDAGWRESGHLDDAVALVRNWMEVQPVEGMSVTVEHLPNRTPLIVAEIEPFGPDGRPMDTTTVLYGHLDKQPEMEGWRADLGPWKPVMEGSRLYGRGGADDGYAAFASLAAIGAVQAAGGSHGRLLVLIEASEESGSPDLPAHIEALGDRVGDVDLVICLDSGCATYDTMWLTTSLRGMVAGSLRADIVTQGLHSGGYGGVVPSTFRIIRRLLDRIEDAVDGTVRIEAANVEIPEVRVAEARSMAELLGPAVLENPPFVEGAGPGSDDMAETLLAKTWRPSLSYIGADGLPPTSAAGNVLRPYTTVRLSLRIPPTADPEAVRLEMIETLTAEPPYGAHVALGATEAAPGWNAPDLSPWLRTALDEACRAQFGQGVQLYGEGGTIPFMGMLGERFPAAQFVITGVLGPGSNAHGPNEFLDIAYAEKLTRALAQILDASTRR